MKYHSATMSNVFNNHLESRYIIYLLKNKSLIFLLILKKILYLLLKKLHQWLRWVYIECISWTKTLSNKEIKEFSTWYSN